MRQDNEIAEVEIGTACGMHWSEEKFVQEFWWETP